MIKEQGIIIKCDICGSDDVETPIEFDYIKQCKNDKCPFYLENNKRHEFFTNEHN